MRVRDEDSAIRASWRTSGASRYATLSDPPYRRDGSQHRWPALAWFLCCRASAAASGRRLRFASGRDADRCTIGAAVPDAYRRTGGAARSTASSWHRACSKTATSRRAARCSRWTNSRPTRTSAGDGRLFQRASRRLSRSAESFPDIPVRFDERTFLRRFACRGPPHSRRVHTRCRTGRSRVEFGRRTLRRTAVPAAQARDSLGDHLIRPPPAAGGSCRRGIRRAADRRGTPCVNGPLGAGSQLTTRSPVGLSCLDEDLEAAVAFGAQVLRAVADSEALQIVGNEEQPAIGLDPGCTSSVTRRPPTGIRGGMLDAVRFGTAQRRAILASARADR